MSCCFWTVINWGIGSCPSKSCKKLTIECDRELMTGNSHYFRAVYDWGIVDCFIIKLKGKKFFLISEVRYTKDLPLVIKKDYIGLRAGVNWGIDACSFNNFFEHQY